MDAIADFGLPALKDSIASKVVFGISFFFAFLNGILIIVALAAWSENTDTLQNTAWATVTIGSITQYVGLRGFATSNGNYQDFSSISSVDPIINDCQNAGEAALGLLLVGGFFAGIMTIGLIARAFSDSGLVKTVNVLAGFFVMIFLVAAFGNWHNMCYSNFDTSKSPSGTKLELYAGFGSVVSAWVFYLFIFAFNLITPVNRGEGVVSDSTRENQNFDPKTPTTI